MGCWLSKSAPFCLQEATLKQGASSECSKCCKDEKLFWGDRTDDDITQGPQHISLNSSLLWKKKEPFYIHKQSIWGQFETRKENLTKSLKTVVCEWKGYQCEQVRLQRFPWGHQHWGTPGTMPREHRLWITDWRVRDIEPAWSPQNNYFVYASMKQIFHSGN